MSRCHWLSSFSTTWRWPAKMVASRNMASFRALLVTLKCFSSDRPHFCLAVSLMSRQCRPLAMLGDCTLCCGAGPRGRCSCAAVRARCCGSRAAHQAPQAAAGPGECNAQRLGLAWRSCWGCSRRGTAGRPRVLSGRGCVLGGVCFGGLTASCAGDANARWARTRVGVCVLNSWAASNSHTRAGLCPSQNGASERLVILVEGADRPAIAGSCGACVAY
jgi:hypothetical protein